MTEFWEKLTTSSRGYVVAEAGVNHLGTLELGERLIREAKEAGADAIKFQSYKADRLTTRDAPRFWDWEGDIVADGSQFDSYSLLDSFGYEEHKSLKETCDRYEIEFLSTPFDTEAADYLERLDMQAYKIASCDLPNHPLLTHVSRKGRPIFLSTGGSTIDEIHEAVSVIESAGNTQIVIMHCNLCYPTKDEDANLGAIMHLRSEFPQYLIGLSDHTMNVSTPAFARTLGAMVFEKHYTVDKTLEKSADHWLSVDPPELMEMIAQIRLAETLLGTSEKQVGASEERARAYARRSVVAANDLMKGTVLTHENLTCKRPGTGIQPKFLEELVGKKLNQDVPEDTLLTWEVVEA